MDPKFQIEFLITGRKALHKCQNNRIPRDKADAENLRKLTA